MHTPTSVPATSTTPDTPGRLPADTGARRLRRAAGLSSLVEGATYVVGFGVMAAWLAPRGFLDAQGDPSLSLDFLLANQVGMYLWYLMIYLVAGCALVVLTLGLHDRFKAAAPALSQVAAAFGLIWSGLVLASGMVALIGQRAAVELAGSDRAEAISTYSALGIVQDAMGGGIELVGAVWVLLLSLAALRSRVLPRGLAVLGLTTGSMGVLTLVPAAQEMAASVFGLGFIAWYIWTGRVLLRG